MSPILELKNVSVHFGGVKALQEIDFGIEQGEFVGLIGPNGAGKTTVFNLITNSIRPTAGSILFKNQEITGKSPDTINHLGISRTFQNIRLFTNMSVFDNVALGMHSRTQYNLLDAFIKTPKARSEDRKVFQKTNELLELVGLVDLSRKAAGSLPYGKQRRLELARAMAASPELLLLDEPAAGMNDDECADLIGLLQQIHTTQAYTVLLIEHHMDVVMELCADYRIIVLNLGRILSIGSPNEIQNDPQVVRAYLGERKENYAS